MTDKKVYSGKEIRLAIKIVKRSKGAVIDKKGYFYFSTFGDMTQQLMDERKAVLKDLKAIEEEVSYVFAHKSTMDYAVRSIGLGRSKKYDTGLKERTNEVD